VCIFDTGHPAVLDHQPFDHGLLEVEVGLPFQYGFHGPVISRFIVLSSGGMDRRALLVFQVRY
jgi:hypothetical protein